VSPTRPRNESFLSLGSNLEPELHLRQALQELTRHGRVRAVSSVWESPALGRPDQPRYLNAVVRFETDLSAEDLICRLIPEIEKRLGRVRSADKSASRPIDIDLLVFNEETQPVAGHRIPSPEIQERAFVAWPLAELAPGRSCPGGNRTFREIAEALGARDLTRRADIQLMHNAIHPESSNEGRSR